MRNIMTFISKLFCKFSKNKIEKEELEDKLDVETRLQNTEIEIAKTEGKKTIRCNGKDVVINWPKVKWGAHYGQYYPDGCYKKQKTRTPKMLVAHWDVCLSTNSMFDVTMQRGISVHFGIDNDGTIHQFLDTKDIAYHAKGVNTVSVGVEICNGVLPKYNEYYKKKNLPERSITSGTKIHGKVLEPYLNFTSEQIEAFKALTLALHKAHGIPLVTPLDKDGELLMGVSDEVVKNTFKGVIGHYHVTTNKVDPGNLPLKDIVEELANKPKEE